MKDFGYGGYELHLARSSYRNNQATYIGLFDSEGECFTDITVNTPYSAINTIVLNWGFLSMDKEYVKGVIDYLTDGKICDIECGFETLPKYWLNMKVLKEIEEL